MRLPFAARVVVAAMLIALVWPIWPASTQVAPGGAGSTPGFNRADPPPGAEALAVQWVQLAVPGLGVVLAAVARPGGAGPFPAVVLLHGTHGFAHEYVRLAQDLAGGGVLAVAACWFRGSAGSGARFVTSIGCPEAPPMGSPSGPEAMRTLDGLVQAVRALPGVRPDRIGLMGHSRGAAPILSYVLQPGNARAAVLNSAGYPVALSPEVTAPILILHGTADSPSDGGVAVTNIQMARDFEAKLRASGKPVEAVYYDGGRHNDLFTSPTQYRDEVSRILAFLLRHLGD